MKNNNLFSNNSITYKLLVIIAMILLVIMFVWYIFFRGSSADSHNNSKSNNEMSRMELIDGKELLLPVSMEEENDYITESSYEYDYYAEINEHKGGSYLDDNPYEFDFEGDTHGRILASGLSKLCDDRDSNLTDQAVMCFQEYLDMYVNYYMDIPVGTVYWAYYIPNTYKCTSTTPKFNVMLDLLNNEINITCYYDITTSSYVFKSKLNPDR